MNSLVRWALNKVGLATQGDVLAASVQRYRAPDDNYPPDGYRGPLNTQFALLLQFADQCEAARMCIQKRIAQVLCTPYKFVPAPGVKEAEAADEIAEAEAFWTTEGGLGGPGHEYDTFVEEVVEDLMVLGSAAMARHPNKGGSTYAVKPISAATIKPLLTPEGWVPQDGQPAYEQSVGSGSPKQFTADEIRYMRIGARTRSRWGRSPTEMAVTSIRQFIGYDDWNKAWIEHGDQEVATWVLPDDWTPEQEKAFWAKIDSLNDTMKGRQSNAMRLPEGVKRVPKRDRKEGDFEGTERFLLARIAAMYSVNPAVLGFASETYKFAQEEQRKVAELYAQMPLLLKLNRLFDSILLHDLALTRIRHQWDVNAEDRTLIAQVVKNVGPQYLCTNDVRQMLGLGEVEGPLVNTYFIMGQLGPTIIGWRKGSEEPQLPAQVAEPGTGPSAGELDNAVQRIQEGTGSAVAARPVEALSKAARDDLARWRRKALKHFREGALEKCRFESEYIPASVMAGVSGELEKAKGADDVKAAFAVALEPEDVVDVPQLADDLQALLGAVHNERARREAHDV